MQFDFATILNMQIRTFYGSKSIGVFLLSDSGHQNVIWTLHRLMRYIKVKGMFIVWYHVWRLIIRLYIFYLSQVKHLRVKFSCPKTEHRNNVPRLRGEKLDITLKTLYQVVFETARQAATSANCHAPTIAPCHKFYWLIDIDDDWYWIILIDIDWLILFIIFHFFRMRCFIN